MLGPVNPGGSSHSSKVWMFEGQKHRLNSVPEVENWRMLHSWDLNNFMLNIKKKPDSKIYYCTVPFTCNDQNT